MVSGWSPGSSETGMAIRIDLNYTPGISPPLLGFDSDLAPRVEIRWGIVAQMERVAAD
jgi:hypothetical protein